MKCIICNSYFKLSAFNQTAVCSNCQDTEMLDYEEQEVVAQVINKSGRVLPVFNDYDYNNDTDSFSS